MTGIRAKLVFDGAGRCPVAEASATADGPVTDVTWTAPEGDVVTEQVTMAGGDGDSVTAGSATASTASEDVAEFDQVFDYGSRQVYEFERDPSGPCICEYIEDALGPVTDVHAADGDLHVTLHAGEVEAMRDLVGDLETEFGGVRVEYLVRSRLDEDDAELVPVDLQQLTGRQREVLERAHELGYFEYPRRANASEVAESLDIGPSTFIEHLNAAQSKLLADLLGRA